LTDYVITVKADSGDYSFSRMGNWCTPFYDALVDAYNMAVLRSLFIKSGPILTAKGDVTLADGSVKHAIPIRVFDNNVTALPPDLTVKRVPLCFVNGMNKGDYSLTLYLDTGDGYTFSKLGYETAPFAAAVEKQIRALREETLMAVKEIDPALTTVQASQIAGLMPRGAAAPIGQLAGIAPSFVAALESKIAATRAAEYYNAFKGLCDPSQIWVGFRKNEATSGDETGNQSALPGGLGGVIGGISALSEASGVVLDGLPGAGDGATEPESVDPYRLWLIAPSKDGQFAAVEFIEPDSATFVYRTRGDFTAFAKNLNRALEAIDFKREVIRLTDEELQKPENADYYMAAKRTAALQLVRSCFCGRVIHSSPENWKRKLSELWQG